VSPGAFAEQAQAVIRDERGRWRYYGTVGGSQPVREFLSSLEPGDRYAVRAAMALVAQEGQRSARHLRRDICEVRASRGGRTFRVLFSAEGHRQYVLLALSAFEKKSQKTPPAEIDLAEARLRE
jgi:phage-related protein